VLGGEERTEQMASLEELLKIDGVVAAGELANGAAQFCERGGR
jgi:roadblock/LC7 domain-containing protein